MHIPSFMALPVPSLGRHKAKPTTAPPAGDRVEAGEPPLTTLEAARRLFSSGPPKPQLVWSCNLRHHVEEPDEVLDFNHAHVMLGTDENVFVRSCGWISKYSADGTHQWSTQVAPNDQLLTSMDRHDNLYVLENSLLPDRGHRLLSLDKDGNERYDVPLGKYAIQAPPLVTADGTTYVISCGGEIWCLDPNGKEKWSTQAEAVDPQRYHRDGGPFLDDGGVLHIRGCYRPPAWKDKEGVIHCTSDQTREVLVSPPRDAEGQPTVKVICPGKVDEEDDRHRYIDRGRGITYLVEKGKISATASDGQQKWSAPAPNGGRRGTPRGCPDGRSMLVTLCPWDDKKPRPKRNHATVDPPLQYTLTTYDAQGNRIGEFTSEPYQHLSLSEAVFAPNGDCYVPSYPGSYPTEDAQLWHIHCFNSRGEQKWVRPYDEHFGSIQAGSNGMVYTGGSYGHPIHALNGETGEVIWKTNKELAEGDAFKIAANGDAVIATEDGRVTRVRYEPPSAQPPPSIEKHQKWIKIGPISIPVRS